jgi:hypothetical protein
MTAAARPRVGVWVAEITGMLGLAGWPTAMRVIVRKERPHPVAQLWFTDLDGHPFTCVATRTASLPRGNAWRDAGLIRSWADQKLG